MAMDPARKAQWVAELRSGNWKQGKNALTNGDGSNCCLGVACTLAEREGVVKSWYSQGYHLFGSPEAEETYSWDNDAQSWSSLPPVVGKWLGVDELDPYVSVPEDHPKFGRIEEYTVGADHKARLSVLNDNDFTFAEIADLIEAQL